MKENVKKSMWAMAAGMLLCSASAGVHAQSNVTIYGRVAGGVDYLNKIALPGGGTGSTLGYGSNQWGTSWWGIRSTEDLGGGLQAVANLESAFDTGTGSTGDSLFNRFAYVGLASNTYGSLWLGRAMGLPDSEIGGLDPMGYQAISLGTLQNGRIWGSRTKTVTYNSPQWGGLSFRAQMGLNGTAGNFNGGKQLGGVVIYQSGPLTVKGLYEEIRSSTGEFNSLYEASRMYVAGGSYTLGDLKLSAGYALTRSASQTVATADNPAAANEQNLFWIGGNYQMSPALVLNTGIYRANRNKGGGNGTLLAVGANYSLSKRTMLYGSFGTVKNGGNAAFSVEAGSNRPTAGSNQQGLYTGMVYSF